MMLLNPSCCCGSSGCPGCEYIGSNYSSITLTAFYVAGSLWVRVLTKINDCVYEGTCSSGINARLDISANPPVLTLFTTGCSSGTGTACTGITFDAANSTCNTGKLSFLPPSPTGTCKFGSFSYTRFTTSV